VTIGEGSCIGAASLVIDDVPPRSLAVGVPARVIRAL
jgi:acetyltransferase-like isoleucine patch superfamily enzyme